MFKWRLLSVIAILSVLIAGCGTKNQQQSTPTPIPTSIVPDKPIYVVERGLVEKKLEFTARVSPVNEEDLFFKRGGYIAVVYADREDWVEAGTILAELEIDDLLSQLALAQVDLDSANEQYVLAEESHQRELFSAELGLQMAELRLQRTRLQTPITDMTSITLAVERAKEALEEAKIAYTEALDRPWEPQVVRDSLFKNIDRAETNLQEVQAQYNETVLRNQQAKQLHDIDVAMGELEVQRLKQEIEWLKEGVDPSLAQRVETAQLKVDRLNAEIQTGQLIAPFDGELTSFNVIPGRAVEARRAVAVIANPDEVDVTVNLTNDQMSVLEEGMPAEVTFSSRPGEVFQAIIAQLPYPYGTGGGEVDIEEADQRCHIQIENMADTGLEVGDLVRVTVLIEQSENALWLPPAAIRTFEGRRFVMVRVGDRLQKVDIKLGVEGADRVEILEGLEEGQVIEGL